MSDQTTREDDTEFRRGVPGKNTREIFMANTRYLFCEILEWIRDGQMARCRTPGGREFVAVRVYGTMMEDGDGR